MPKEELIAGPKAVREPAPLRQGGTYRMRAASPASETPLSCTNLVQRNWSRVCTGVPIGAAQPTPRFFLKQALDRSGRWHPEYLRHENAGTRIARELLAGIVDIPEIVCEDGTNLVTTFQYREVVTFDVLLRRDPERFNQLVPHGISRFVRILEAMKKVRHDLEVPYDLPVRERDFGGPSTAILFKGFDFRNAGFGTDIGRDPSSEPLIMFDLGRPYLGPIEEAAAQLFVSIGMLNWGRPLTRFWRGPNLDALAMARDAFEQFLDPAALRREIDRQRYFREAEIQARGGLELMLKKRGLRALGRPFLGRLSYWCEENVRERGGAA